MQQLLNIRQLAQNLHLDRQATLAQFQCKRSLVDTLQQAWSESAMNLQRGVNNDR